ncbi:MAG TPA: LPS export ABC transporter periplasmic protein LptC [Gammaproteobacteria bacterium]|nr:LPS export ABC transporter periplasmic protein LptC [Gammaproteobacteria bacterium]
MYKNLRNGAAMLMLAAAAVAAWYFGRPAPPPSSRAGQARTYPLGYYLRDAVLLGTSDEGRVSYRLKAGLAEERPDASRLVLEDVHFEYEPSEQVPWTIAAARGEAPIGDRTYLDLEGDVRLERVAGAPGVPARVETDRLRLEPAKHLASTSGPVRVAADGGVLEAVGLKAFLAEDRLELESEVHGHAPR